MYKKIHQEVLTPAMYMNCSSVYHLTLRRQIKLRKIRWARHVTRMGQMRNAYKILVGKPEGKRPLGRARRSWEDNIRMDLREIEWQGVDWMHLA
jgi:hypothetical protein